MFGFKLSSVCQVYWRTVLNEMHITFSKPPKCILQMNGSPESQSPSPGGQWLPGAVFNPAKDCLSLNENRSLDDVAIIWRDEGCDNLPVKRLTVGELRTEVWYITVYISSLYISQLQASIFLLRVFRVYGLLLHISWVTSFVSCTMYILSIHCILALSFPFPSKRYLMKSAYSVQTQTFLFYDLVS